MQELKQSVSGLVKDITSARQSLDIDSKKTELEALRTQSQAENFWQDNQSAQAVMQKIASSEQQILPWDDLLASAKDTQELVGLGDESLLAEIEQQLQKLQNQFRDMQKELAYSGPYDHGNAILNFYAGAGGTDAQDWTQMLLRMYSRWAEKSGFSIRLLDESSGDEAGIKSATLEAKGNLAYGKLKGEHGVHRLVRLSPFNSDNLRQTSFAKVEVLPEVETPEQVPLDDKDLRIDVFRAGGHGGQSVNTTDSAVRVTHLPTNITVSIQNERSQIQNKETALTILRSKLASLQLEQHKETIAELKGPAQANEWGSQIRNYVLHPYKQVKDLRTKHETTDVDKVLDGDLSGFIEANAKDLTNN